MRQYVTSSIAACRKAASLGLAEWSGFVKDMNDLESGSLAISPILPQA